MNALVLHIARPITLWSLHFIAIYALISAACAPRGLIEADVMRAVSGIVTLGAAVVTLAWLIIGMRTLRQTPDEAPERPLVVAVAWTAAISLVALFANLWPVAFLATCSG
ncbi:MAG: hypothetical protein AAFR34_02570 [Pseudomonadota bacterium]